MVTTGQHNLPDSRRTGLDDILQNSEREQKTLGYENLWRGLLSKEWQLALQEATKYSGVSGHGVNVLALIIKAIWEYGLELWTHRNNILHETNNNNCTRLLAGRISQVYEEGKGKQIRETVTSSS